MGWSDFARQEGGADRIGWVVDPAPDVGWVRPRTPDLLDPALAGWGAAPETPAGGARDGGPETLDFATGRGFGVSDGGPAPPVTVSDGPASAADASPFDSLFGPGGGGTAGGPWDAILAGGGARAHPASMTLPAPAASRPVAEGMNREEVELGLHQLTRFREELEDLGGNSIQIVHQLGSNWFGADSERFQDEYGRSLKGAKLAHDMLDELIRTLRKEIGEQQSTSRR